MTWHVRFTREAQRDLNRLYEFVLARDPSDWALAERAIEAIRNAIRVLETSPFTCRKAMRDDPFLREGVIPFGHAGFVALFEIEDDRHVTVLAVRHQREDDFH